MNDRAFAEENITTDSSVIISPVRGAVVEDVRTIFARTNDTTIYIPSFKIDSIRETTISGSL
jgi:hypothetical protein